ncbi:hypothetical protein BH09BAC2_BH09BAC2_08120 [soil metagenome]
MKISLENTGKRFNREWIFRNVNYTFTSGNSYAITGQNGSGKSTLLQVISGSLTFNEGSIKYEHNNNEIKTEKIYKKISITAPYLELVEEMNLHEFFAFHHTLKPLLSSFLISDIINIIGLEKTSEKQIRYFSSGMKQRVKLAQAIFSDVPVVLLDEPATNLDAAGIELYRHIVQQYCLDRLLIISSNDFHEYNFCNEVLDIKHWK